MPSRNYASEILIEFLRFASRNQVHILFDEIYALSIFDDKLVGQAKAEQPDSAPFISVLSIPDLEQYCEKDLIHVAYGMSKVDVLSCPYIISTVTLSPCLTCMCTKSLGFLPEWVSMRMSPLALESRVD